MTPDERAGALWTGLNDCMAQDRGITMQTVTHWLEHHGAGFPDVPLMQERIREDASLWAASASQVELETYAAAAIMEMEKTPILNRAAKRLAALSYRAMNVVDQDKFKKWIEGAK